MATKENGVLVRLLSDLDTIIKRIESKKKTLPEEYEQNWETQYLIERLIQNAVQCCLDIGARIIAKEKLRVARNYKDIFQALQEGRKITPSLADKMTQLVHLRNELTHEYRDILPQEIFAAFQKIADPLKDFFKTIKKSP